MDQSGHMARRTGKEGGILQRAQGEAFLAWSEIPYFRSLR